MKGYTTKTTASEHNPEVVEDKVIVYFDAEDAKWRISRTTVTRRTVETTDRHESTQAFESYADAAIASEDHKLPVYVPSGDRHRAEEELTVLADKKADKVALDQARRARRVSNTLAQEE